MDPTVPRTMASYGGAADQRNEGAVAAAGVGAVGVLVRSLTLSLDDVPHTGEVHYDAAVPRIPAAALSTRAAEALHAALQRGETPRVRLRLNCRTLPDVGSANVVGELVGSELPREVVVLGAHLDAWDKGQGAHDDGSGCAHVLEALRLLKELGVKPRRTLRAVLFTNDENGGRGGRAFAEADRPAGERTIAALESDQGGFAPVGFGIQAAPQQRLKIEGWARLWEPTGATRVFAGGGGADTSPLGARGVPLVLLEPETDRYFDYHHSDRDTVDTVHPRELERGAIALAILSYLIAEEGL
jgi:hypothetical protein